MSVSIFPPVDGGGGGGAVLPEGAIAKLVEGKLTTAGYNYPDILPAGTYRINCSGNSVIANFGSNSRVETISGSKDVTIASGESSLNFTLAQNFGGTPNSINGPLPMPTLQGLFADYSKSVDFKICPTSGNMVLLRGSSTNSTTIAIVARRSTGEIRIRTTYSVGNYANTAGAVDSSGNIYVAHGEAGTQHRVYKYNPNTGVGTFLYSSSAFLTNFAGVSGMAVSPNGNQILVSGINQNRAIFSNDGGSTWTNVTLPGNAYTGGAAWDSNLVKYQAGYWFIPSDTTGTFFISTNGTTWNSFAIPGASSRVSGFATDGTTFLFATNNTHQIYRSTTLGTFTAISLTGLGTNTSVGLVEFGAGRWICTSSNSSNSQGMWWISTDSGATWIRIDDNTNTLTYGNLVGNWNSSERPATSAIGISQNNTTTKVYYDPTYNDFAATQFSALTTSAALIEPMFIDATNFYKWLPDHQPSDPGWTAVTQIYAKTWSTHTQRWYYTANAGDFSYGIKRTFSYDPVTANVRTEPWSHASSSATTVATSNFNLQHYVDLPVGNRVYRSVQSGSGGHQTSYHEFTNPTQFWKGLTNYITRSTSANPSIDNLYPHVFPNGSAYFIARNNNSNSAYNLTLNSSGVPLNLWTWADAEGVNFATALHSGAISYNTTANTMTVSQTTRLWTNVPYPVPELSGSDATAQYRTSLPTGTSYYYASGNNVVLYDATTQNVRVSTNGGASYVTYAGPVAVSSIFERSGTFYILTTVGTTTRILKILDWATSKYELVADTGVSMFREAWEHTPNHPTLGLLTNPVIHGSRGETVQLFSIPNQQPNANLFMYDMNLEVL